MITRCLSHILLGTCFFIAIPIAPAAPTFHLLAPSYEYTPDNAFSTIASDIADDGTIVGGYASSSTEEAGYLRFLDGSFSLPIIFPGGSFTTPTGINTAGIVCGSYISSHRHGFFFDGTTYTQFDLPGNVDTYIEGENDAGDFVGLGIDAQGVATPFISAGGSITPFTVPGATSVSPRDINNLGQVVGYYSVGGIIQRGFFRDADGTLTYPIDFPVPGSTTEILGLNDRGAMVGLYSIPGGGDHAFVLRNGRFFTYDYPNAEGTLFGGINNSNTIGGYFRDERRGNSHAFIVRFGR